MAADEYFLDLCTKNKINGILRFYSWEPEALTIGYFFKKRYLNLKKIKKNNIKVVRRITGGNLLHHHNELTYSLIIKKRILNLNSQKDIYLFIASKLRDALKKINIETVINTKISNYLNSHICYDSLSQFELVDVYNKKIAASSQKVLKNAYLQHGTIYLDYDFYKTLKYIKSIRKKIYYFFSYKYTKKNKTFENKNDIMISNIKEQFLKNFDLTDYDFTDADRSVIVKLIKEKYSQDEWNFRK